MQQAGKARQVRSPAAGIVQEATLELLGMEFLAALAAIVVIDLVLAGDNAIVIALASRNVPRHRQRQAIIWGTVGAIVARSALTMVVVSLLRPSPAPSAGTTTPPPAASGPTAPRPV